MEQKQSDIDLHSLDETLDTPLDKPRCIYTSFGPAA